MLHNMISGNIKLKESEAFSWFVFNKGGSLLMDIIQYIAEVGLENEDSVKILAALFSKDVVNSKTMRETVQSFNVQKGVISKPIAPCDGQMVHLNEAFLKVMAIMRRLKWTDEEIKDTLLELKNSNQAIFVRYVLPYMFLFGADNQRGFNRIITMASKEVKAFTTEIILNPASGTASIGSRFMRRGDEVETNFEKYINAMFNYIS